jgi:hypothetical protein
MQCVVRRLAVVTALSTLAAATVAGAGETVIELLRRQRERALRFYFGAGPNE